MKPFKHKYSFFVFLLIFFLATIPISLEAKENSRITPTVKVIQENADAVVNISTESIVYLREDPSWGAYGNDFDFYFGEFFGYNRPTHALKLKSVGSGVIVDEKEGLVITNAHVVHMATNTFVILNDGTQIKGEVVYENPADDLALIKIKQKNKVKQVRLGQTSDIMIGETVLAIGNPLGLENTVTRGIISGKNREIGDYKSGVVFDGLLQTDAPINPGNSGGALLNLNGDLVGINVAVVQDSQSIGFAIPVEKVKNAIKTHENNKKIAIKNRRKKQSSSFKLPDFFNRKDKKEEKEEEKEKEDYSWSPLTEIKRIQEEMDQMFEDSFSRKDDNNLIGMFNTSVSFDTNIEAEENNKEYIIQFDITGLNKDKLNVEINNYSITISGEYSNETNETSNNRYFSTKSFGSFMKTIPMPDDADAGKVKTEIKNNILTLTLPKK